MHTLVGKGSLSRAFLMLTLLQVLLVPILFDTIIHDVLLPDATGRNAAWRPAIMAVWVFNWWRRPLALRPRWEATLTSASTRRSPTRW